jgi:hypothetical protein
MPRSVAGEPRCGTRVRLQASAGAVIRLQADDASGSEAGEALVAIPALSRNCDDLASREV